MLKECKGGKSERKKALCSQCWNEWSLWIAFRYLVSSFPNITASWLCILESCTLFFLCIRRKKCLIRRSNMDPFMRFRVSRIFREFCRKFKDCFLSYWRSDCVSSVEHKIAGFVCVWQFDISTVYIHFLLLYLWFVNIEQSSVYKTNEQIVKIEILIRKLKFLLFVSY